MTDSKVQQPMNPALPDNNNPYGPKYKIKAWNMADKTTVDVYKIPEKSWRDVPTCSVLVCPNRCVLMSHIFAIYAEWATAIEMKGPPYWTPAVSGKLGQSSFLIEPYLWAMLGYTTSGWAFLSPDPVEAREVIPYCPSVWTAVCHQRRSCDELAAHAGCGLTFTPEATGTDCSTSGEVIMAEKRTIMQQIRSSLTSLSTTLPFRIQQLKCNASLRIPRLCGIKNAHPPPRGHFYSGETQWLYDCNFRGHTFITLSHTF